MHPRYNMIQCIVEYIMQRIGGMRKSMIKTSDQAFCKIYICYYVPAWCNANIKQELGDHNIFIFDPGSTLLIVRWIERCER